MTDLVIIASVEPAREEDSTLATEEYANERPDHLGIVAGVCQEIGLAV